MRNRERTELFEGIDILSMLAQGMNVDDIIDAINQSKRPVIIGGNGIRLSGSKDIFRKFVDYARVPVLLTWSGIDLLDDNNEYQWYTDGTRWCFNKLKPKYEWMIDDSWHKATVAELIEHFLNK